MNWTAFCATLSDEERTAAEERAAILEFDSGMKKEDAENMVMSIYGWRDDGRED